MAEDTCAKARFAELEASQELNRRIIEALPGGMVHVGADGAIKTANAEAQRILGLSYGELTRRFTQDFAPMTIWENGETCRPEDYPITVALATGQPQPPATIGLRTNCGKLTWAVFTAIPLKSHTGETTGAVVTFLDITASKEAELGRRESEALLRSVVQSVPSIVLTTTPDGTILFINRTSTERTVEAVTGSNIFDFVELEQQDIVRRCMEYVLASGESDGYELTPGLNLERRIFSVRVAPIKNADLIVALTFVVTDITETRLLQSRVALSDRLASIGTLAAGVAHEINNPLTYLLLSLHRAARVSEEETRLASIAAATEAAQRIQKIVGDLGAWARTEEDKLDAVDLVSAVESAVKMSATQTRYRARLIRDYCPTPPVLADAARLSQVFLNLLINAAQAIAEGNVDQNSITIRIRPGSTGMGCVEIIDTGCGISSELLPRIFEPFVTTKEVGEGTGLGLHICHNIVSSFQGTIDVTSTPGKGASFAISLPMAKDVIVASAPPKRSVCNRENKLRVLVVDDEPAIRESFELLLAEHDVRVAASGREAVEILADATFDAIFCDLIMPDMTGMEVHEFVMTHRPDLAASLVFMTGGAFTESADAFLEGLAQPVLAKPFSPDDIDALLAGRLPTLHSSE